MATTPTSVAILTGLTAGQVADVEKLLARVAAVDGTTGIDPGALASPTRGGVGDPAPAPDEDAAPQRAAALVATAGGATVGYAQVTPTPRGWEADVALDPVARAAGHGAGDALGKAIRRHVAAEGGGTLRLWLRSPRPADERLAAAAGVVPARALYQVRRPLPVEPDVAGEAVLPTRSFVPGDDEAAWVAVNNRAFAWHPEQGGWTVADVVEREGEAWFDADGFRLHDVDGDLAGFCWTKVHAEEEPAQGEIYVIAVDPDHGGRGLGRGLVLAGLDHLARRGITVGMLYVDAANVGAVKLYADLGFEVHHVNVQHTGDVPAAEGERP